MNNSRSNPNSSSFNSLSFYDSKIHSCLNPTPLTLPVHALTMIGGEGDEADAIAATERRRIGVAAEEEGAAARRQRRRRRAIEVRAGGGRATAAAKTLPLLLVLQQLVLALADAVRPQQRIARERKRERESENERAANLIVFFFLSLFSLIFCVRIRRRTIFFIFLSLLRSFLLFEEKKKR